MKIRQKDISTIDHKIISFSIGENESSKYWLQMLNDLKNRGIKNVLVICADGLNGIQNIKDV